ncbi:MAG: Mur ligase family protein [Candidatus Omnitrophica bacterium]|nr:Mur ligase family protein [Candidatus Omnitrophota bacterium]
MRINDLDNICVVGWSRTGISLTDLCLDLGKKVFVTESLGAESFDDRLIQSYSDRGVVFEWGGHSEEFIKYCSLIIVSPGVDLRKNIIGDISITLKIPLVGEIEFCFWLTEATFVAITGTNGKTTTTSLVYEVLKRDGKNVFVGGNIGVPLSSFVLETKKNDIIVLEISSFQLETVFTFRPHLAAILNIEPDHLDRYTGIEDYFAAKCGIFRNQTADDWAILNRNDKLLFDLAKSLPAQVVFFDCEFENENFSCVYQICRILGVERFVCEEVFSEFKGYDHRFQFVKEINDITFINDSKATNPASTIWALKNVPSSTGEPNIHLIAGGKDKGLDYRGVIPYLGKVKKVYLLGEAALKINQALKDSVPTEICDSLTMCLERAFLGAKSGDFVLFSPMCASFDMFRNYIERGERFIEIANALKA